MGKIIEPVGLPSWHDEHVGAANTDKPIMDTGALAPLFDTEPEQFEEQD
jgi:hypothetical protein